jgi:predicted O-methyltransferase YrrM
LARSSRRDISAPSEVLQRLHSDRPLFHASGGELTAAFRLDDATLEFLDEALRLGMRTVETGAGTSTVLFAARSGGHTCIAPDSALFDRIRHYCGGIGVDDGRVAYIVDRSEQALPRLNLGRIDLALIDGRHGFPAPFIDWYYLAGALKTGGLLIVDDVDIWTGQTLADFLANESDWKVVEQLPRAAAFRKRGDSAQDKEWTGQPFVYRRSKAAIHHPPEFPGTSAS